MVLARAGLISVWRAWRLVFCFVTFVLEYISPDAIFNSHIPASPRAVKIFESRHVITTVKRRRRLVSNENESELQNGLMMMI